MCSTRLHVFGSIRAELRARFWAVLGNILGGIWADIVGGICADTWGNSGGFFADTFRSHLNALAGFWDYVWL